MAEFKYWAFLSYSHRDKKWGDWLHKALETYRLPRRLIGKESRDGKVPQRVYPIFRDREELPVSADLGININEALRESRYLIVICSPHAAQSRWVGEEIKTYKQLGREDRILALIVDGEPNASDGKAGLKIEDECFHEAMRYRVAGDGKLLPQRTEPIAADVREGKDGKNNAKLKLLAGLLGISYDDLRRRDHERRLRRARSLGAIALLLILTFAGLAVALFFARQEALKQETKAKDQTKLAFAAEKNTREIASRGNVSLARYSKEGEKNAEALAHLAQALRLNPENREASNLTIAMLTELSWYVPLTGPMRHESSVFSAQFSPDGQLVMTTSWDGTVRLWDAVSGKPTGESIKHAGGEINSAQFSPDGQRVVTVSKDKMARLWNAASGKPIGEPLKHAGEEVNSAQFSPDGQRMATASADKTARLWDAVSAKPIGEPMNHADNVLSAQFSPDGKRLVTASADKTARLWDAVSAKPIGKPMKHADSVLSARFSPDGRRLVTVSADKAARLWDAVSGKPIGEPMQHGRSLLGVTSAQFSPDGQRVVTTSADGPNVSTARLWDAISGKPIGEPIKHESEFDSFSTFSPEYEAFSAQFSPDGQQVVTTSNDTTVRVWDAITGASVGKDMKHKGKIKSVQFSPDELRVVTASSDKTVQLWDAITGAPLGEPMKHADSVLSAQFSPDGKRVVTASVDHTAQLWDTLSGKPIDGESITSENSFSSAHFSPDGQRLVTASYDMALLWNVATGKPIGEPMKHADSVLSVQFSPDGQRVATASADKTARLWDASSGKPLGEPMKHDEAVCFAQFTADSQHVLTVSTDSTEREWDAATGKPLGEPRKHEGGNIDFAQFSPDCKRLVTALRNEHTARLWDAGSGKPLGEPMKDVSSVQFSPDGQRVVTASWDNTAQVWDAATAKQIGEPMKHEKTIWSAQISPDGQRVVTASWDKTARLWDAVTGKPIGEPMTHRAEVDSAQFSPDGQRVVTASWDTTARLWDAATGKPIGEPIMHDAEVDSAQFSPDGQRVLTTSRDKTGRMWDAVVVTDKDTREDILLLAELAEATGGLALETVGQAENLKLLAPEQVLSSREKIAAKFLGPPSKLTSLQRFLQWSVADRRTRTISPFSLVTVSEWLENRIKVGDKLGDAVQIDPTNARVTAYLGGVIADWALKQDSVYPDAARRARGQADFLTRRAVNLAPDDEEVKQLRDQVVKLLVLKTN